jgi:NhaP-type Na+/H+ or K+/H+ antiporter
MSQGDPVGEVGLALAGHKLTAAGGGLAVSSGAVGWLADNHLLLSSVGILVGIAVGLYGLVLQRRRDRREHAEHIARMSRIVSGE